MGEWKPVGSEFEFISEAGKSDTEHLPNDIAKMMSLESSTQVTLAGMNDKGKSFNIIADWIEENL